LLSRTLLKIGFLPPLLNIIFILVGLILLRRYKKLGLFFCLGGIASLYLLSTPYIADRMLASIEVAPVLKIESIGSASNAAIVVLGAGHIENQAEYSGPWPDVNAIARLNYAARIHRLTNLPLLLTGGQPGFSDHAHAEVMADYLWKQMFIRATWLEKQSRTTEENARYSRQILAENGIDTVVLVTQSVHMRRAVLLFEREGIAVIPAPTELRGGVPGGVRSWLPSTGALHRSQMTMHEMLGYWWYRLAAGRN